MQRKTHENSLDCYTAVNLWQSVFPYSKDRGEGTASPDDRGADAGLRFSRQTAHR